MADQLQMAVISADGIGAMGCLYCTWASIRAEAFNTWRLQRIDPRCPVHGAELAQNEGAS